MEQQLLISMTNLIQMRFFIVSLFSFVILLSKTINEGLDFFGEMSSTVNDFWIENSNEGYNKDLTCISLVVSEYITTAKRLLFHMVTLLI